MYYVKPYLVSDSGAFSRASSATYSDAAGVLRYAAIDVKRPIIELLGSTNLIPRSNSFTEVTGCNVLSGGFTGIGPDGTSNGIEVRPSPYDDVLIAEVTTPATAALVVGATYSASIYVREGHYLDYVGVRAKLSGGLTYGCIVQLLPTLDSELGSGKVVSSAGATNTVIEPMSTGYIRISFRFIAGAAETCTLQLRFAENALVDTASAKTQSSGVRIFGAQVEPGPASSYIPTTGTAASRSPDVIPVAVPGNSELQYSNVPLTTAIWAAGTDYAIGNQVVVGTGGTDIYEALAASTGVNPTTDTTGKWLKTGKVNRWRMFDGFMSTGTSYLEQISVVVRPYAAVDCIWLFGLAGYIVTVIVIDDAEGEVYRKQTYIRGTTPTESSWWAARHTLPVADDMLILSDLPLTATCSISIQIANTTGLNAECGMCLVGRKKQLGLAQWGARSGIADYSVKDRDAFGNPVITERSYADRADYPIMMLDQDEYQAKRDLAAVRAIPCVYVGSELKKTTIVYGYFKNFDFVLPGFGRSEWNLEVEGFV